MMTEGSEAASAYTPMTEDVRSGVRRKAIFDAVADEYHRARPTYPAGIYDVLEEELGGLAGAVVVDIGAGTGIASRQLLARGATVIALDLAEQMLRHASTSSPTPAVVRADGTAMPLRHSCADLACFAQAWHWFDVERTAPELVRILRPSGLWAAWWSHPRADGEAWFDALQDLFEQACPAFSRLHRDTGNRTWEDEPIAATGLFGRGRKVVVPWIREVSCDDWLVEFRSTSYVNALEAEPREELLAGAAEIIRARFPDGRVQLSSTTHIWMARAARAK
jgi:ubiquinone/menaquinone biosynthesis C-methylase UbiE